jgi:two-component system, chemotaxis family, sensor kinase CheA
MGSTDKQLLEKLLATFEVEAEEHIAAISSGLVALESASSPEPQTEIVEKIFREAHSLKGAARAVNLVKVESACQSLESIFARLKSRQATFSPELLDQLHRMADGLGQLLPGRSAESTRADDFFPSPTSAPPDSPNAIGTRTQPSTLHAAEPIGSRSTATSKSEPARLADQKPALSETLRVSASKLDTLLRQAEEFIPVKATVAQRIIELREIRQALVSWEAEWRKMQPRKRGFPSTVNREVRSGGGISPEETAPTQTTEMKVAAFLERNANMLSSVNQKLATLGKQLEYDRRAFERRVDDLVEDMKRVSMLPFSTLLESFPKLVRDLSHDCGKEVELSIIGGEIETDRRILEEVKNPLIHLVRNCIDHGVETPKIREEVGKPRRATIRIAISPKNADKVEIAVSDDGAGVDIPKVRAASLKLGLVSKEDAKKIDEQQIGELIFKSGLSTSPMITEVSGRGLGLAIVREKVEKVGGTVSVKTQAGTGTTFRLVLPLTLARFRGILVRVGESLFVVPTRHVQSVLRVSHDEIKTVANRETIRIDGRTASAVHLGDILEIARRHADTSPKSKVPVLALDWVGEQIGFFVDEILEEQEVLVKSLGKQLPRVRNIAGATILCTGKVLPVLNVADLMQSAAKAAPRTESPGSEEERKSILVAEDSITSRTLLKNILELAGYRVKTAVDGADALTTLASEGFDLVVSDVEMPRMSGFELTTKIRADKRLAQLPVVLVTGLDSREDRERGVDAGASAYIVKSSFDQGNLLEVVRRLI